MHTRLLLSLGLASLAASQTVGIDAGSLNIDTFGLIHNLTIQDVSINATADAPYGEYVMLNFSSQNEVFHLNLSLKRDIFSEDAQEYERNENGGYTSFPLSEHVAYEDVNVDDGYVRITMLEDNEFAGLIRRNGELFVIEHSKHHWDKLTPTHKQQLGEHDNPMVMYRFSDVKEGPFYHELRRLTGAAGRLNQCDWPELEITIGVASDAGHTIRAGGRADTKRHLIGIFNQINAIFFEQVGVRINIGVWLIKTSPGGETWNVQANTGQGGKGCGKMVSMHNHLPAFRVWVKNSAPKCGGKPCGLFHLFTDCFEDISKPRESRTFGLAHKGTICWTGPNSAISNYSSWRVPAHELGHNFGADHTHEKGGIMANGDRFYDDGDICAKVKQVLNGKRNCFTKFFWAPIPIAD